MIPGIVASGADPGPSPTFDGFTEHFLDQINVAASSGVTFAVGTPTKDAGNPLFTTGTDSDAWDTDKLWAAVTKIGSTWHAFYGGYGTDYSAGYASSSDGTTFTKPNLGLITYGGNSNNNLIATYGEHLLDGFYDAYLDTWVVLTDTQDGSGVGKIYTVDTPGQALTLAKSITPPGTEPEVKSLVRRADGRWVLYYVVGHSAQRRSVHAMLSDTDDLTGTWTDTGVRLASSSTTNQFYALGAFLVGSLVYGVTMRFNSSTNQALLDLFSSRDGLTFSRAKAAFIDRGASTAWDDEMILGGHQLAVDGNSWHFYYVGSPANHAVAGGTRNSKIGRATVARARLGSVGTTGSVTTASLAVADGATMKVNANASGGTLKIEVQDSGGTPLTGYAEADFDTISTDVYDATPTWGGMPLPDNQTLKLKFVLSSATLYGYEISDASSLAAVPDVSDTFTRSDNAAVMGTTDSGHTWGTVGGVWGISSNRGYCPDTTVNVSNIAVIDSGRSDGTVQVTLVATTGATSGNYGIAFRVQDALNCWRWAADDNNDRLYLQKRVNSTTWTAVATVNSAGIAAGDVLKVVLNGSSIECYHNGTLKASTTDSAYVGATSHGLIVATPGAGVSTATRWDNFTVTA